MADKGLAIEAPVDASSLTAEEKQKLGRLLTKAQAGDAKAMDELRPLLDKTGLWGFCGDLSRRVRESWLEAMTGQNRLIRESYERKLSDLRRDLLADGDSPLERLLADRIVATWLQVSHADMLYAMALKGDGHSLAQGTYLQARQDRANARHLRAIKTLASVRRLLTPAVQVNIGRNQIISQGSPAVPAPEMDA